VDALAASLNSMLDISRLDSGVFQAHSQPTSAGHAFVALKEMFADQAEQKGISLRLRSADDLWVDADPVMLNRILANLVSNALKYTATGSVLVTARRRLRGDQDVEIAIRDSGPGISREFQDAVFDEFFQLQNPGRDRAQGLGLGLAIVKRMVKAQGMRIGLQSEPGRGSTFFIHCRAAKAPAEADRDPGYAPARPLDPAKVAALRGIRVLVVDDEAAIADALADLLAGFGAIVFSATEVATALRVAAEEVIDVAILDHRMAGSTGAIDLAADLDARAGRTIPYVIVTGDTAPAEIKRLFDSGAHVCFKPLSAEALVSMISNILLIERAAAPQATG
jgi:CheY-like chemotaxis protein/anti-sigma regulatory factor (Ser/Thr protein kinase)